MEKIKIGDNGIIAVVMPADFPITARIVIPKLEDLSKRILQACSPPAIRFEDLDEYEVAGVLPDGNTKILLLRPLNNQTTQHENK